MGLLSAWARVFHRRRPSPAVRRADSRRGAEIRRKRETLQKRAPTPLDVKQVERADAPSAAELGISTPRFGLAAEPEAPQYSDRDLESKPMFRELPANYIELPAEPAPRRPHFGQIHPTDPHALHNMSTDQTVATSGQRSQSLQRFPSCLVPGSESSGVRYHAPVRAATWSDEAPKDGPTGFGSGWWSGNGPHPGGIPNSQNLSTVSPSWELDNPSASTIFPSPSPVNPLSSEISLISRTGPDATPHPLAAVTRRGSASHLPLEATLSPRHSSSNMKRLMARHSVLESRRQILLQLHEIEQQQQLILEELADMPEEDGLHAEAGGHAGIEARAGT